MSDKVDISKAILTTLEERHNQFVRVVEDLYVQAQTVEQKNAISLIYDNYNALVNQAQHQNEVIAVMIQHGKLLEQEIDVLKSQLTEAQSEAERSYEEGAEDARIDAEYLYEETMSEYLDNAFTEGHGVGYDKGRDEGYSEAESKYLTQLAAKNAELNELNAVLAQWEEFYQQKGA
jgi:flagellar biosynthesis/type III secretory pathway protein FliH